MKPFNYKDAKLKQRYLDWEDDVCILESVCGSQRDVDLRIIGKLFDGKLNERKESFKYKLYTPASNMTVRGREVPTLILLCQENSCFNIECPTI